MRVQVGTLGWAGPGPHASIDWLKTTPCRVFLDLLTTSLLQKPGSFLTLNLIPGFLVLLNYSSRRHMAPLCLLSGLLSRWIRFELVLNYSITTYGNKLKFTWDNFFQPKNRTKIQLPSRSKLFMRLYFKRIYLWDSPFKN